MLGFRNPIHTVDYDPFIEIQLASTQLTLGPQVAGSTGSKLRFLAVFCGGRARRGQIIRVKELSPEKWLKPKPKTGIDFLKL